MDERARRISRALGILGLIAAVVVVGVALGWLMTRRIEVATQTPPATPETTATSTGEAVVPAKARVVVSGPSANQATLAQAGPDTNAVAEWESRLDEILSADTDETQKAKQMLAILPSLPEAGQVEAAQHLSNLLPDAEYAPLGKLLTEPKTPEAVLDVLMVDALNRPNSIKLPLLLEMARVPQHPKATEAKDLLELYLEEDYGTDWNKWQAKMQQWLKDNPD
jgi:hypothetical protein